MYFSSELLSEYNVNTISFKVNKPVTPEELLPPREGKSPGFELLSFVLQPSLPPVAHAGGGYKGLTYTNSVEALDENAGTFIFFEIDFEWTKDKRLIGLHDWGNIFTGIFGFEVDGPLDYNEFRELEIVSGITPLDLYSIKEFLSNNPAVKIVTDIKSDNINALYKIAGFFPDFAQKFILEVLSYIRYWEDE